MSKPSKDKDQDADKRRDDLAKRVLKMPPQPKTAKTPPDHKAGKDKPKPAEAPQNDEG